MRIHLTQKTGVLGVLCVPDSLKASNDAAFSDGTQAGADRNTWCAEHELCSSPPQPEGRPAAWASGAQTRASGEAAPAGAWGIEAFDPFDGLSLPASSTCRWVLIPDESRLMWEWNPWQLKDDIDELFARVFEGTATAEDGELFDACMIDRFISRVQSAQPVELWIMESLADAFFNVLMGGAWEQEIQLPGRNASDIPRRVVRWGRDIDIYRATTEKIEIEGVPITKAIGLTAEQYAVSYESARAAYYRWRTWRSKNSVKP